MAHRIVIRFSKCSDLHLKAYESLNRCRLLEFCNSERATDFVNTRLYFWHTLQPIPQGKTSLDIMHRKAFCRLLCAGLY